MRVAVFAAGVALLAGHVLVQPGWAQEGLTDKLYACIGMSEGAARLACYDAAVADLKKAQSEGDVAVVSRAQVLQAEKDTFGLGPQAQTNAIVGVASSAAPAPEIENLSVTITLAEKRPNGTYRFTLDNGQVWEQTDTVSLGTLSRGTMQGEIRRAAMGSFMLKPGNRPLVRVKRIK